ncbi:MAG: hypothetical protein V3T86_06395 [Planctomycetota bacterium]
MQTSTATTGAVRRAFAGLTGSLLLLCACSGVYTGPYDTLDGEPSNWRINIMRNRLTVMDTVPSIAESMGLEAERNRVKSILRFKGTFTPEQLDKYCKFHRVKPLSEDEKLEREERENEAARTDPAEEDEEEVAADDDSEDVGEREPTDTFVGITAKGAETDGRVSMVVTSRLWRTGGTSLEFVIHYSMRDGDHRQSLRTTEEFERAFEKKLRARLGGR